MHKNKVEKNNKYNISNVVNRKKVPDEDISNYQNQEQMEISNSKIAQRKMVDKWTALKKTTDSN